MKTYRAVFLPAYAHVEPYSMAGQVIVNKYSEAVELTFKAGNMVLARSTVSRTLGLLNYSPDEIRSGSTVIS